MKYWYLLWIICFICGLIFGALMNAAYAEPYITAWGGLVKTPEKVGFTLNDLDNKTRLANGRAFGLGAGYSFGRWDLGVEAGYIEADATINLFGFGHPNRRDAGGKFQAVPLLATVGYRVPLGEYVSVSLNGGLGAAWTRFSGIEAHVHDGPATTIYHPAASESWLVAGQVGPDLQVGWVVVGYRFLLIGETGQAHLVRLGLRF